MNKQHGMILFLVVILTILMLVVGCSDNDGSSANDASSTDSQTLTDGGNDSPPDGTDSATDDSGAGSDSADNLPPVAQAGADQTTSLNVLVDLDGTGSYDPDQNYPLIFSWKFTSTPEGSNAVLSNAEESSASFTPDLPGDYVIELIVTDSLAAASEPAEVTVSTVNSAPVAEAGPNQKFTQAGVTIRLDGSQSFDPDGDPIDYAWIMTGKPASSAAQLVDADGAYPTFTADMYGTYTVELLVTDPVGAISSDDVFITSENTEPVAVAGCNQAVMVGDTVFLDGSGSYDLDSDPLTYQWALSAKPTNSIADLTNKDLVDPYFEPDLQGNYTASLVVSDGTNQSDPSSVNILAVEAAFWDDFIAGLAKALQEINGLDDSEFVNINNRNALTNKILSVMNNYLKGSYDQAMVDKLRDDIGGKMDGYVLNQPPALDANDWILTPGGQISVYPYIDAAAVYLQNLLK